ncbi:1-aminocyclopropane-1-carboxylate deaminase/D-cysteine desulfhydrase [Acinetobacter variabilis]|uniref:1-aminocyclopropane-1-carboxylate deaminase/D-cysteine desulfhydrase n=1 Tax=Acinetobacter variabilis TaxID=70346 RepID=UPI002671E490|nr:pyridoxal-phosphate dependent enzyme [Acinetobacter variabilis]WKT73389.1 pyridoxal-phosphate dependent enzyme [Acinetobacter variabilis]
MIICQKIYQAKLKKDITIIRDDLYPFLGGGNKGRKIDSIGKEILTQAYDAVVTTGGIQSNHCRATAIFCAQYKLQCTLVLHGDKDKFLKESGNAKIMRMSGANIIFVDQPKDIGPTMDQAMFQYKDIGLKPYYLWGGGHNHQGGKAYIDAVHQLDPNLLIDYLFVACGTGSTQAGIMAGLSKRNESCQVIGISVARNQQSAQEHVYNFYNELCDSFSIEKRHQTIVLDDYLCGGYELYNDELKKVSDCSVRDYGFALDTTYSGKAFWGMQQYILKHNLHGNIVFWHTGGIFNFLA